MLTGLKKRLAEKRLRSPLFDSDRLRRNLEEAYKTMWTRHQAGDPPWSFDVEANSKAAVAPPPAPPPNAPPAPRASVPPNPSCRATRLPRHLQRRSRGPVEVAAGRHITGMRRSSIGTIGASWSRAMSASSLTLSTCRTAVRSVTRPELGQVGRDAFEDEVDLAQQHPAFPNQRLAAHESLEGLKVGLGLARQMYHSERDHLAAQLLLVEKRAIAAIWPPPRGRAYGAGRRREMPTAAPFDIGSAASS